jgi:hypothetical protein
MRCVNSSNPLEGREGLGRQKVLTGAFPAALEAEGTTIGISAEDGSRDVLPNPATTGLG